MWILKVSVLIAALAGSVVLGGQVGRHFEFNLLCCQVPRYRNLRISVLETFGLIHFYSQIGQDRWASETVFPGQRSGFFLDVGSGDGTIDSNSKALEGRGWTGICVDPFPTHMEGRTCRMVKAVVSDRAGKQVAFRAAGEVGGINETLGQWKGLASNSPLVSFSTTTLGDILDEAHAPAHLDFVSLDIEGAELDALKGFPFDRYTVEALDIEHNYEEPKRSGIEAILEAHGYHRVHTWMQDDYYLRR